MYLKIIMKTNKFCNILFWCCNILFLCCLPLSCATTPSLPPPPQLKHQKLGLTTSFTHHGHYLLLGLIKLDKADLQKACMDGVVVKTKKVWLVENLLFALFTLGIYTPKSTKIWCRSKVKF